MVRYRRLEISEDYFLATPCPLKIRWRVSQGNDNIIAQNAAKGAAVFNSITKVGAIFSGNIHSPFLNDQVFEKIALHSVS